MAVIFKGKRGRYNSVYYVENLIGELCREDITSRSSLWLDAYGRLLEIEVICCNIGQCFRYFCVG